MKPSILSRKHCLIFFFAFIMLDVYSQQWDVNKKYWFPDGEVKSILHDTTRKRIYIGGDFQTMGPVSPYGAQLNYSSGDRDIRFSNPDNDVRCVIKDGKGGWYIGGDFTKVGDSLRGRIVHINNLGQVTSTFAGDSLDQSVSCLMLKDSILYIGGTFTSFGKFRSQQAIFDSSSHKIDFRFPVCNGSITTTISDKQRGWFVAGNFTTIGDSSRKGLAYIDSAGRIGKWNPSPDSTVTEMVLDGTNVYIGGLFNYIGGSSIYRLAAVHYKTGVATSWNASVGSGSTISKMLVKGSLLYVAGLFTSIGGATRNNLAAIDISSGAANSWNPNVKGLIKSMIIVNSNIYIAGDITNIGSKIRKRIGSINISTGAATNWDPVSDNTVNTIQAYGQYIIAGGLFQNLGSTARKYLAAIDTTSGIPSTWNPAPSAVVNTCIIEGNRLYIGGAFTTIATLERKHFALYNMKSAKWDAWYLIPPTPIGFMSFSGRRIFVGGFNGPIGDTYRNGVASYNVNSRKITGWNPLASGVCTISNIVSYNSENVIVGGLFAQIGGKARNNIARINVTSGIADSWNPNANASISCMQLHKDLLYVSGTFTTIGGLTRNRIAALDTSTGQANTTFVPPTPNASVNVLLALDSTLFIGGRMQFLSSVNRNHLASLNARTGSLNSWNPNVDQEVFAMAIKGKSIFIGGQFENVNSPGARPHLAEIDIPTAKITSWNPLTNDVVYAIALTDSNLYVGGHFYSTGRKTRRYFAAVDENSGQLLDWGNKVDMDNYVSCMLLKDTTLYLGGAFRILDMANSYINRGQLAALGVTNAKILSWAPNAFQSGKTTNIYALETYGNNIYIAGEFPSMNSVKIKNLAAVGPVNGVLTSWNPLVNKPVRCLYFKDTTLYIGGDFDSIYGRKRYRAAAISMNFPILRPWKPVFSDKVYDLKLDGNKIYAAGDFDSVNSTFRTNFALVDKDSGTLFSFSPKLAGNSNLAIGKSMQIKDSLIYIAGFFPAINNVLGNNLASLNKTTGLGKPYWYGVVDEEVNKVLLSGKFLFAGGYFNHVQGKERIEGFAVFNKACTKTSYLNLKQTACQQYTLNGITYKKTGIYKQTLTNRFGCDSFINIDLKIRDSSSRKMTVNACGPYILNKQTYTSTGVYYQKLVNIYGCDSFIYLNLTITPKTQTIKTSSCGSYILNGQTYTSTGIYTQNLKSYKGCDSILTLDLKIFAVPSTYTIQASGCDSLNYNGIKYTSSGTYNQKRTSYTGCDSFIVLKLNIFNVSAFSLPVSACKSYLLNGQTYNTSGTYVQKLKNYNSCDSILTLQLKILNPSSYTIQTTSCRPYILNGQVYSGSGVYTQKKQNYLGCDSNITLDFTRTYINNGVSLTGKTLTADATGHTYQWVDCNNNFIAISGETNRSFTPSVNGNYAVRIAKDGCDSLSKCYVVDVTNIYKDYKGQEITVYPNPVQEKLQINFERNARVCIKLTDLTGKTVIQKDFIGKEFKVDVSGLNSGMYLLSLFIDGEQYIYRVIKE